MFFDHYPLALSIDLETLSLDPRAHILQVGFCVVNVVTGEVPMKGRNRWLSPDQPGRIIDPDTVVWWLKQDPDVRSRVWCPTEEYTSPEELFEEFQTLMVPNMMVWTRGNKDPVWLETLWGGKTPWHYRQASDLRGFIRVFDPESLLEPMANDSKHDGAADAMYQAQYLMGIVRMLREMEKQALRPLGAEV